MSKHKKHCKHGHKKHFHDKCNVDIHVSRVHKIKGKVKTNVSGNIIQISGQQVEISGQPVTISGNIVQISGQAVVTDSGSVTNVSGNVVQVVNISGQTINVNISGITVSLSGATLVTTVSGNPVQISGQEVSVFTNSGEFVAISGIVATSVSGNIVQVSGQIIQISGQGVLISGQAIVTDSGSVTSVSGNIVQIASGQTITATANISGQHVGVFGTTITLAEQDIVTNAFTEIGHPHDEIHEGKDFISSDLVTGVASGTAKNYLVLTSSPKIVHMLLTVASAPGSTVRFIENPTVTVNGSGLSVINHSRVSGIASITSVFSNTVFTSGTGTLLEIEEIGSATSAGKFGGETSADRNEAEWDLKTSGQYVLNIVALANNTDISTKFRWYEV